MLCIENGENGQQQNSGDEQEMVSRDMHAGACFDSLPADLIQRIAALIPNTNDKEGRRARHNLHIVCKRFNEALREPCEVWSYLQLHARSLSKCQPWFVNWLRPRAAAIHTLDATFSSDDSHRLELLLSLLGRTLQDLRLRSDTTDVVFGSSHISQPVLSHLACCPRLKRLTVSSAELMSVDLGALRFLDQLQEVSLTSKYDNTHHALPEPLLCLGQLRSLHIRFPSLTSIQGAVSKLTALQRLRIEGLQGSLSIEPGLGQLGSLQSLTFKDCSWLGDLSPNAPSWCPSLSGLTSLTELVFNHCPQLNTVPDAVCELTALRRLVLSTEAGVWGGEHARRRSTDLQVPDNLGRLTNLRTLVVGLKTVKAIPEPILQLTGLESLAITFCKLQRLPASVAAMRNLRTLCLQGNPGLAIQESEEWAQMGCLETLTLSDIANLSPKSSFLAIARLPALMRVSLKGSMPADSQSFKTLLRLSNELGARGIPVES
ncbi:g11079 [Coccomyxa elongata]